MKVLLLVLACLALCAQTPPEEGPPVKLNLENQPSFGPANAPVTVVEFGDFECPSCRAEWPVIRQLLPDLFPNKLS